MAFLSRLAGPPNPHEPQYSISTLFDIINDQNLQSIKFKLRAQRLSELPFNIFHQPLSSNNLIICPLSTLSVKLLPNSQIGACLTLTCCFVEFGPYDFFVKQEVQGYEISLSSRAVPILRRPFIEVAFHIECSSHHWLCLRREMIYGCPFSVSDFPFFQITFIWPFLTQPTLISPVLLSALLALTETLGKALMMELLRRLAGPPKPQVLQYSILMEFAWRCNVSDTAQLRRASTTKIFAMQLIINICYIKQRQYVN